jgi:hypothetical protein
MQFAINQTIKGFEDFKQSLFIMIVLLNYIAFICRDKIKIRKIKIVNDR